MWGTPEDLTQDAFLQVFRCIHSFRGDLAFTTWLHRVAVNTVLMKLRRRKATKLLSLDEPVSADSPNLSRDIGQADLNLGGTIDRIALGRAVEELPAGCRRIFDVCMKLPVTSIMRLQNCWECSIGNSKSQLHKAKMKMRDLLSPKGRITRRRNANRNSGSELSPA